MTYIAPLPKKLVKNAKAKMMNNIKNKRFKITVFFILYLLFIKTKVTFKLIFSIAYHLCTWNPLNFHYYFMIFYVKINGLLSMNTMLNQQKYNRIYF